MPACLPACLCLYGSHILTTAWRQPCMPPLPYQPCSLPEGETVWPTLGCPRVHMQVGRGTCHGQERPLDAMGKSAPVMAWTSTPLSCIACWATPAVLSALYANWKTCRSIKPHWVQRQLANQPAGPCRLAQHCGRMESPGPLGPPISPICCRKDTRAAAAAPGRYTTGQPPSCGGLIDCHRTQ